MVTQCTPCHEVAYITDARLHDAGIVEITTLGSFDVRFRGESLLASRGSLRKILELFKYFITFRNKRLVPEAIIDDMWPGSDFQDSKSVLRTQIFRLRTLIEEMHVETAFQDELWLELTYASGYYVLKVGDRCRLDTEVFQAVLTHAESVEKEDVAKAMGFYKQALSLYEGPYMAGQVRGEWLLPVQNRYHRIYLHALSHLLKLLRDDNAHKEIIEVCEKSILLEPYDESLHLHLLHALMELGDTKSASSYYSYITSSLYRELGVKPSAALRAFYRELQGKIRDTCETDFALIKRSLADEDDAEGAYCCDRDDFRFLCQVEIRRSVRTHKTPFLGLITISNLGQALDTKEIQVVTEQLTRPLKSSLRKGDVFTWWNPNQLLFLLVLQDRENLSKVGLRLSAQLREVTSQSKTNVKLEFLPLTSEDSFLIK